MMDSGKEFIELSTIEDSESEEENKITEKDNKYRSMTFKFNSKKTLLELNSDSFKNYISLHHPDISTPPPKVNSNTL